MGDGNFLSYDEKFREYIRRTMEGIDEYNANKIKGKKRHLNLMDLVWMRYFYDLDYHTTEKWRMGGAQFDKIKNKMDTRRTIDFIFHTKQLKRVQNLSLPSFNTVMKRTGGRGLPAWAYPSDHLAIGSEFEFMDDDEIAHEVSLDTKFAIEAGNAINDEFKEKFKFAEIIARRRLANLFRQTCAYDRD